MKLRHLRWSANGQKRLRYSLSVVTLALMSKEICISGINANYLLLLIMSLSLSQTSTITLSSLLSSVLPNSFFFNCLLLTKRFVCFLFIDDWSGFDSQFTPVRTALLELINVFLLFKIRNSCASLTIGSMWWSSIFRNYQRQCKVCWLVLASLHSLLVLILLDRETSGFVFV